MKNKIVKRIQDEFQKTPDLIIKELNYLYLTPFMLSF